MNVEIKLGPHGHVLHTLPTELSPLPSYFEFHFYLLNLEL